MSFHVRGPGGGAAAALALVVLAACGGQTSSDPSDSSAPAAEFKVAQPTAVHEFVHDVALGPNGTFAVAWLASNQISEPTEFELASLRARLFDGAGRPLGPDIVVHPETGEGVGGLTVRFDRGGGLFASWLTENGLFARGYDSTGQARGGPFRLLAATPGLLLGSSEVFLDDAGQVVVFADQVGASSPGDAVVGRRFSTSGTPLGSSFLVDTGDEVLSGDRPALLPRPAGTFLMSWSVYDSASPGSRLRAGLFSAEGVPAGPAFAVDVPPDTDNHPLKLIPRPDGGVLLVWASVGSTDGRLRFLLERFDVGGVPLGAPVTLFTPGATAGGDVQADGVDDVVLAWSERGPSGRVVPMAQRFSSTGATQGAPFPLATTFSGDQFAPRLAVDSAGTIVAAWSRQASPDAKLEVWARRVVR